MSDSARLRDYLPVIVAMAIAVFAFVWSYRFEDVPPILARGFQPGAFPRLVAGLILILGALALIEIWRQGNAAAAAPEEASEDAAARLPRSFWLTVAVLALCAAMVAATDFLLALMVVTGGISFAWGERRWTVLIGLTIVAPLLVLVLFDQAFDVRFPRGFLTNLYYG